MDIWHFTLGGIALIAGVFAVLHRNRRRSVHFRFDWDSEEKYREEDDGTNT